MARRKTPRLAYPEYVSKDLDNSIQVWQARLELIAASRRVFPTFLEALSAEVFPFYSKLAQTGYKFDRILWSPTGSPYESLTEDGGLKRALSDWAAKLNADCRWLLDEALRTLRDWSVAPEWRAAGQWHQSHGVSSSGATGEAFEFRCEGWDTERHAWSSYRDSVCKRFEKKLSEYQAETRKLAESRGLVRTQRKYSTDNFDWFVLYQFAGWSSTKIAKRGYGEDPDSTVLKGIKTAARLIGWDHLRKPEVKRRGKIR